MLKYKMIVSDFDDTILHDDLTYSEKFVDAVQRYTDKGGKFVIATGRMTSAVIDKCRKIGINGELISYQGAVITDIESGKTVDTTPIPCETAAEVSRYIDKMGLYHHIYEDEKIVAEKFSDYGEMYARFCDCETVSAGMPLYRYISEKRVEPVKILIMEDPENVEGHIRELDARFNGRVLINTSKTWLIEIISIDINKGIAVRKLAEKYGFKREEIICIGDSLNDAPMIEYAGLGVAVKNGSKAALSVADIIAPSNEEDGVAYIIEEYGMREE